MPLSHRFLGWEGSPKIDDTQKVGTLVLSSLLDLDDRTSFGTLKMMRVSAKIPAFHPSEPAFSSKNLQKLEQPAETSDPFCVVSTRPPKENQPQLAS